MPETINPKGFIPVSFTLAAGARQQFETANGATLYVAEGAGISPGGLSIQFDEDVTFRVAVGDFIRIRRFDKIRVINNLGVSISGVIFVSSDPDFLFLAYPRGI